MKSLLIALIVLTGALTTFAQTGKDSTAKKKTTAAARVVYTCPMHPEVTCDKPGKCPKCGMTLVKKTSPARKSTMQGMKMDSTKH